jgi:hypothetical protein
VQLTADNPRIKRGYSILVYCHNNEGTIDRSSKVVVLYNGVWHTLGHSVAADGLTLGEPLVDIHKYDKPEEPIEPPPVYTPIAPGTLNLIEEEQQTQLLIWLDSPTDNKQRQENNSSSNESGSSSDKTGSNTVDQSIRNSPIARPLSMATQTQQ